ncbi:MAG: ABC transporter substrate-binding protein [Bacteroidaceae bacterium]|nr:ABC transporter substrate-binding protein [Bacteroidaceae bacterium]
MKKLFSAIIAVMAMCFVSANATAQDRSEILKVYNWADYIDEDLLDEFEEWYFQETGKKVEVSYQLFDINEIMLTKIEIGKEDYDVVCPSDYIIERMLKKDLLLPIDRDFGSTPDYTRNISPFINGLLEEVTSGIREGRNYAIGYMWGTTGILYNTKYVTEEEANTWGILWNPKFTDKILMKDAFHDVYCSVMLYLKQDVIKKGLMTISQVMNDYTPASIQMFLDTISKAKSNFNGWEVDFGKERMAQEKAWVNLTWSGDAMWALDEIGEETHLAYTVPKEGSNIWFDGWVIPKYAQNVEAARYFINFMCMPENAMRNMDYIGYVSAVATPEILESKIEEDLEESIDLSYFFGPGAESVKVNSVQYPDKKTIENCAMMHDAGDRTEALMDMWSQVKGDSLSVSTVVIIVIVLGAGLFLIIKKSSKKKSKKSSKRK